MPPPPRAGQRLKNEDFRRILMTPRSGEAPDLGRQQRHRDASRAMGDGGGEYKPKFRKPKAKKPGTKQNEDEDKDEESGYR